VRSQQTWNLSNVAPSARIAARVAARDQGLSLGEWLTSQILHDSSIQKSTVEYVNVLDRLDEQVLDLAKRLIEVEDQVHAGPLGESLKKLHDDLKLLNAELLQTTGETAIQTSALAERIDAMADHLDKDRAESVQNKTIADRHLNEIAEVLCRRDAALKEDIVRVGADITATRSQVAEKSRAADEAVERLQSQASELFLSQHELGLAIEAASADVTYSAAALREQIGQSSEGFALQSAKAACDLEAVGARLEKVEADTLAKSDEIDLRLKRLSENALEQNASLVARLDGFACDAKEVDLRGAEAFKTVLDRHGLISERIDLHEKQIAEKLSDRHASHDAFRGEASQKIDALQQDLQTLTTETAQNSAAISDCSDLTQSLKHAQGQTADKADTLEHTIDRLNAKLEAACAEALKTSSDLSAMHAELIELSALQAEDGVLVGGGLTELRGDLSSLKSEVTGKLSEMEKGLTDLREQRSAVDASLDEKLEAVDDKLIQLFSNVANAGTETQTRLASSEQDLVNLDKKFSDATDKISENSGVLWQLLTQVADQSATELRSLKFKVQNIEEAVDLYHAEAAPAVIAMKERATVVCQSIRNIEARQNELANLLMLSHQRDVATASAISMLEQNLKHLEARMPNGASTVASECVTRIPDHKLGEASDSAQHDVEENAASAMATISESVPPKSDRTDQAIQKNEKQAGLAKAHGPRFSAADFDEWDAENEEPAAAALPTVEETSNAELVAAEISDAVLPNTGRADTASSEHRGGEAEESKPTATRSAEMLPVVKHSVLQPVNAEIHTENETDHIAAVDYDRASSKLPPIIGPHVVPTDAVTGLTGKFADVFLDFSSSEMGETKPVAEGSVSFLAAARQAAKNAAENADSEKSEIGAFRKYFGSSSNKESRARYLRKAAIQLVGAAALFAICVAAAKYFAAGQSILPRALASIDGSRQGVEPKRMGSVPGTTSSTKTKGVGHPIVASLDASAIQPTGRPAIKSDSNESATAAARESFQAGSDGKDARRLARESGNTSTPAYAGGRLDQIAALAMTGNANAQLAVGLLYLSRGDDATNSSEAVKWFKLAANSGNAIAQYRLGALYAAGRGVPADQARAVQLYETAANLGNRKAMYNLALAYVQGKGVAKNPPEMVRWFLQAANLGLVDAQFDLAVLYERGAGAPQSLLDAYRWYAIAAQNGDKESKRRMQILATQLPENAQAAAEKSADEFKVTPMIPNANVVANPIDLVRARP
jgi:TPR repeat protein